MEGESERAAQTGVESWHLTPSEAACTAAGAGQQKTEMSGK